MRVLLGEEMMYPASALQDIKRRAIKELAEKFHEKCKTELKVLAWEYGEGALDVINIFSELVKEVCGE